MSEDFQGSSDFLQKSTVREEFAAGGIVQGPEGILLIKVKNLDGVVVWTFPKGRLEAGEKPQEAALREVREETGWRCRVTGDLGEIRYRFIRDMRLTHKTIHWYYMAPEEKEGEGDPNEVLDVRWYPLAEADRLVTYKSDKKIMAHLQKKIG